MSVTAMVKLENSRDINGNDVEDGIKSEQLSDDDTLDVDGRKKNLTTLIIPEPKKMSLIPGIAHTDKHSRLLFEKQSPSSSPVINPDMPVYPPFQWQPHLYPGLPHHFPYYPFRFPGFPFPSMSEHFGFRPYTEHLNAYLPHSAMFSSHPFPTGVSTFQLPGGNDKLFCTDSKIIESDMNGMKSAFDTVKNNSQSPKVYKKAVSPPIDENVNVTISERKKSKEVEQTKYQCSACQKSYSTFSGLSKHKQFHCTQDTKTEFTCKYCDKIYVSLGALKMHIRTHTLPCKCKICGKAFSRPWLLQGHIRTHTGEKPFSCVHCLRAFADRSNLRAHLQTHSDIKKYSCKTCNKTFSRMSLLSKHEDTCGTMDL